MEDRELSDAEWERELRESLIGFRKATWADRSKRAREDDRRRDPWVV